MGHKTKMMNVYAVTVDGIDRYIGAGSMRRVKQWLEKRHRKKFTRSKTAVIGVRIIAQNLSRKNALDLEAKLIAKAPFGQLVNHYHRPEFERTDEQCDMYSQFPAEWWAVPENKEQMKQKHKDRMKDPKERAKCGAQTVEGRKVISGLRKEEWALLTRQERVERIAHMRSFVTDEGYRRSTQAMRNALTPDALSRRARTRAVNMTEEKRSAVARKGWEGLTDAQKAERVENMRKGRWENKTAEERSAFMTNMSAAALVKRKEN
jgi:hypothetical protein